MIIKNPIKNLSIWKLLLIGVVVLLIGSIVFQEFDRYEYSTEVITDINLNVDSSEHEEDLPDFNVEVSSNSAESMDLYEGNISEETLDEFNLRVQEYIINALEAGIPERQVRLFVDQRRSDYYKDNSWGVDYVPNYNANYENDDGYDSSYDYVSTYEYEPIYDYGDDEEQINVYGNSSSYSRYGDTLYGSEGDTYSQYGNTIYGSDGSTYSKYGNTVYGNDGSTYSTYGNTTYGSDGTSYSTYGNTTYGSDGSSFSTYGNTTYINPALY